MAKRSKEEIKAMLTTKLDRWWEEDSSARKRMDWQWFLYDLWKEGYHYARYDKAQKQILTSPKTDGKPKVTINKIEPTVRAIVNYALRNRPKAEVTPSGISKEGMDEIVNQNLFLDFLHDKLGLRAIERGSVEEALTSGISWVQILWDEDAEDGQGQISVNEIDKYDLYWSAKARSPEESRRYTLAVSRSIDELKTDEKYKNVDWTLVKADNQRSSSSLKERLMRLETGDTGGGNNEDGKGNVMLRETWYYGDKDLGEDPETIYVCAMAGGQLIREPEATDLTRSPFFRLCTSRKKLQMVGKSWVKNLIPLNRRLNQLMSSLAEYNVIMNKGYWIADKGAGVRTIKNEHGIIIEKKRNYNIVQGAIAPLSSVLVSEIQYILQMFEDIGSVHDATMGRIPTGAKSGKALEALQVGDSNNLSEVVENTEIWLEEIYEYILSLAAEKYQFARDITPTSRTGQREFLKVVGESASTAPEAPMEGAMSAQADPNALVIKKKNVVDVKITSYLAHTAEARREAIRELAQLIPDLDPQTILEVYEVGPIADIIQRIGKQKAQNQQDELAMSEAQAQVGQTPPAGAQEAIAVIRSIVNGQAPDLPPSVGPEFIDYFDQFLQSDEAQQLDEGMVQLLQKVRDQLAATQGQQMTARPSAPKAPSAGGSSPRPPMGSPTT